MAKQTQISTLDALVEAKNYNKWISDEIKKYISGKVLEIGAGTGNLTSYFLKHKPLYVSEMDDGFVKQLKKKWGKKKGVVVFQFDASKNPPKKLKGFFSSVFSVNVLEHIRDDKKALKNIHTLLKKDGKLVLLVPAKKFAFTSLDKELGHFRRYEKKELVQKLEKTGYKIEKIFFFNFIGLFSWIVSNKFKRSSAELNPFHVRLFDRIVPVLRGIESYIKVPIGISLIIVAQKKQ